MSTTTQAQNGNGQRSGEYEETPDYGTAFHRPDNQGKQPDHTGTGLLSSDTLDAIKAAGGGFQIALWESRTKGGVRKLRVHIEPPYQPDEPVASDELADAAKPAGGMLRVRIGDKELELAADQAAPLVAAGAAVLITDETPF